MNQQLFETPVGERTHRPQLPAVIHKLKAEKAIDTEISVSESEEDFDWSQDDSIILPEQPATACYFNKREELVIRQRRWPDDDVVIFISPASITKFLDKITDVCGVPSAGN
jgi:hypothetical protein